VLAFLNIVGEGMRGNPFEQDLKDMDPQVTGKFALDNKTDIVGINWHILKAMTGHRLTDPLKQEKLQIFR